MFVTARTTACHPAFSWFRLITHSQLHFIVLAQFNTLLRPDHSSIKWPFLVQVLRPTHCIFYHLHHLKFNPASKNQVYMITFEVEMKILKIYCLLFMSSQHAEKAGVAAHWTFKLCAVPHICKCLYSEHRYNVRWTNNNKVVHMLAIFMTIISFTVISKLM
jgi:hypothetical protein